jgi:hypothetical protein
MVVDPSCSDLGSGHYVEMVGEPNGKRGREES